MATEITSKIYVSRKFSIFLQSANAATAYELDNNGRQLAEVRIEAKDIKVVTNSTKTVYTYIGEFLVAIGMLITGGWLVVAT